MSDKVLAFDIGLRKETESKFTGPDYSVDSKPVAIDGNNLCGGTPNSTKAGGTGESLGMSTQKPIKGRLVTGEMGTVSMEIEKAGTGGHRGIDPKKRENVSNEGLYDKYRKRKTDTGRHERSAMLQMSAEGGLRDAKLGQTHPGRIRGEIESPDHWGDLKDEKTRKAFSRRYERSLGPEETEKMDD